VYVHRLHWVSIAGALLGSAGQCVHVAHTAASSPPHKSAWQLLTEHLCNPRTACCSCMPMHAHAACCPCSSRHSWSGSV
jgi:hypothetical protein